MLKNLLSYFLELTNINTFYAEQLAEATRKFAALKSELSCQYDHNPKSDINVFRHKKQSKPKEDKLPPRKLQDLKGNNASSRGRPRFSSSVVT